MKKLLLFVIQIIVIHGCDFWMRTSDGKMDLCLNNQCERLKDPDWIMVRPVECKTNSLSLTFSNYDKYQIFLKNIQWKLSNLFPGKSDQIRKLNIFLENLPFDDRLIDEDQLNQLGSNLDYLFFYLPIVPSNHSIYRYVHQQSHSDFIQIHFDCHSLRRIDETTCSTRILPPSIYSPRRPLVDNQTDLSLSSTTIESMKEESQSIDVIMIIVIPLLILLITIVLSIFLVKKLLQNRSKIQSPELKSCIEIAQPYQISQLPLPHVESIYRDI